LDAAIWGAELALGEGAGRIGVPMMMGEQVLKRAKGFAKADLILLVEAANSRLDQ